MSENKEEFVEGLSCFSVPGSLTTDSGDCHAIRKQGLTLTTKMTERKR
jgi:hypothetical protein